MFVLRTLTNRIEFSTYPVGINAQIKEFLFSLKQFFVNGNYHAASFQRIIIVPLAGLVSLLCFILLIRNIKVQSGAGGGIERIKTSIIRSSIYGKLIFVLEFIVLFFSVIAALYDSGLLDGFIKKFIPILSGFHWGRIWYFNIVLWYVIFAICLQYVSGINVIIMKITIGNRFEELRLNSFLPRLSIWVLVCIQLLYISLTPAPYNDQIYTWYNELAIKTGIAEKIRPNRNNYDSFISYKEFFAEDLFMKIKKDISYSDEMVVAFGFQPSVLMYNGFNCIDGQSSIFPLSYKRRFRALVAPELEINQKDREWYDNWGCRLYLFNSELSNEPTRNKDTSPVKLNIDMGVFKNDFNGKYILSRAEISNSNTLGLELIKRYYDDNSIYTIYLYQAL